MIGLATAKTAEEHGLRVDVMAPKLDVEDFVDALADFGTTRRMSMLETGQPVTKLSERKPRAAGRPPRRDDRRPMSERETREADPWSGHADCAPRRAAPSGRRDLLEARRAWCCRCSSGRALRAAPRSARCPASCSTAGSSLLAGHRGRCSLGGVMLFGIPEHKDSTGTGAVDPGGIPNLAITDVVAEVGDALTVAERPVPRRVHRPRALRRAHPRTAGSTTTARSRRTPAWRWPRPTPGSTWSVPAG